MTTITNDSNCFNPLENNFRKESKVIKIETGFITQENSTPPMFDESVTPPPHVWEKIARALDQQDSINNASFFKSPVSSSTMDKAKKKIYFAAFAITAFSCLLLLGK